MRHTSRSVQILKSHAAILRLENLDLPSHHRIILMTLLPSTVTMTIYLLVPIHLKGETVLLMTMIRMEIDLLTKSRRNSSHNPCPSNNLVVDVRNRMNHDLNHVDLADSGMCLPDLAMSMGISGTPQRSNVPIRRNGERP
jgi:hypothetical protein